MNNFELSAGADTSQLEGERIEVAERAALAAAATIRQVRPDASALTIMWCDGNGSDLLFQAETEDGHPVDGDFDVDGFGDDLAHLTPDDMEGLAAELDGYILFDPESQEPCGVVFPIPDVDDDDGEGRDTDIRRTPGSVTSHIGVHEF